MTDLFKDLLPAILQNKSPVITEENEKDYNAFVVNRALSFHHDCVLYVNELNKYPGMDKLLQFHYLINSIRSYKRPFRKWEKRETVENLEAIREYFNFSYEKAKEALTILSDGQIDEIKKQQYKGGLNDGIKRVNRGKTSRTRQLPKG